MFKFTKIIFSLFSILFIISGCAAYHPEGKGGIRVIDSKKESLSVGPAGSYEECFIVKPGQKLIYKFRSSKPADFNIHYHGDSDVHYPVLQKEVSEADGVIDPDKHNYYIKAQEYYCLMWENPDARPFNVSYECTVVEK
ncbi:MAG: hypothetical protein HZA14_07130 [Nitrospirae bacterium]|nr:hypothetical protein [Nitrospirota bacterium]